MPEARPPGFRRRATELSRAGAGRSPRWRGFWESSVVHGCHPVPHRRGLGVLRRDPRRIRPTRGGVVDRRPPARGVGVRGSRHGPLAPQARSRNDRGAFRSRAALYSWARGYSSTSQEVFAMIKYPNVNNVRGHYS